MSYGSLAAEHRAFCIGFNTPTNGRTPYPSGSDRVFYFVDEQAIDGEAKGD